MSGKNTVGATVLALFDTADLDNTFKLVDVAGLAQPCFLLRLINTSTVDVGVSYDGINLNDIVLAESSIEINTQTNAQPNNYASLFPVGTKIWVTEVTAPSAGDFGVAGYYQK